ncbi:SPFH domain-containing protein [Corynebacterium ulceribovis]|uniref:SPFH domain-containing protein n=1 Tax=Corynebacterium ulceribovis TaxID=487732 RepID=UPI000376E331|nr:SPFH domain-containing protein [Corynebacterium ulceribovis]
MSPFLIFLILLAVLAIVIVSRSIIVVSQGSAAVIERLGKHTHDISAGIGFLIPFIDRVREKVDIRERLVSFPPQAVITQDNLTVAIDTVVTFQVNDPARAVYGVENYIFGVEQITTATLRDVVGGMTLEQTLTSREFINRRLRGELDEATSRWGLRIARVELKAIDPPPSIQQAMEKQMKADREKRAMILTAEGQREADIRTAEGRKQSQILAAEGDKHAAILAAEGSRQSMMLTAEGERAATYLRAQGEARAIQKVNAAIRSAKLTPEVLAYQYLEKLPKMAEGGAMWVVPSQFGDSLEQFVRSYANKGDDGVFRYEPPQVDEEVKEQADTDESDWFDTARNPEVAAAVQAASEVANRPVDEDDLLKSKPSKKEEKSSAAELEQKSALSAQKIQAAQAAQPVQPMQPQTKQQARQTPQDPQSPQGQPFQQGDSVQPPQFGQPNPDPNSRGWEYPQS